MQVTRQPLAFFQHRAALRLAVQAGILHGDGDMGSKRFQDRLVVGRVGSGLAALHGEQAHAQPPPPQDDRQPRTRLRLVAEPVPIPCRRRRGEIVDLQRQVARQHGGNERAG